MSRQPPAEYPLHKAAFFNDTQSISRLVRDGADLYQPDMHGNTALHLSIMLGHKEATSLLLAHNAPVKAKNMQGWNCLMEAVSYGDRIITSSVLRKLKSQSRDSMASRKPHLLRMLSELGDFYLELKWDFHSWIPLLSKMLPSDLCKIYKWGTCLRLDTTLVDFNDRTWERGDISFIYDSTAEKPHEQLVILDNKAKVYQRIRHEESDAELDEEVDVLMSSDIVSAQMSTKPITFQRAMGGWIFKHERTEQVGDYTADFYSVEGMALETRKRREHLSAEDIKKNKAIVQSLTGGHTVVEDEFRNLQHRKSLPPPGRMPTTWEEYIGAAPGLPPPLGRAQVLKQNSKHFKATVAMSEEFPLEVETLLDILEIVAPFKHLDKLRRFCQVRLPPGFPVRVEIPLLPTISAKVTFQKLVFRKDLTAKMFKASRRLLVFLSSIDHGEFVKNRPLACESPPVKRTASSFLLDPLHHHHPFKQQRLIPSDSTAAFVPFFGSSDATASSRSLRDSDEDVASRHDGDVASGGLPNLGGISLPLDGLGRYNAAAVCLLVFE
uniref:Ankyrin repeat domain-containing protein 13C n=1 Tax=Plectus sambesii TaxID=2011161 RepID=A0A914XRY3_9BILA